MTVKTGLTIQARRMKVYDGIRSGHTARQLARYLGISESTVRRDVAAMPSLRQESASWPDAARWRP
jgi:DNA-binding NarL/FixJ family response regulator